jgi:hypothetical protein
MTARAFNDNNADGVEFGGPSSHGQDAMLLVESLIHGLIAKSVIDVTEAIEIVNTAAEVKEEIALSLGDSAATLQKSLALLEAISSSLKYDLPQKFLSDQRPATG